MTEILVLYASTHGHTGRIATGIGLAIERAGATADVRRIGEGAEIELDRYDAVVVGASIHAGKHQRQIVEWVRHRAGLLNAMPGAFFSVSLTAAEGTPDADATARRLIAEFTEATGWRPSIARSFAGALQYREYRLFTRFGMKMLMKRGGHPTDTRRDYDYTDWAAVDEFGAACARLVPEAVRS